MLTAEFPARHDQLIAISAFVMNAIKDSPFDSRQRYAIDLAVDEACANVIDHAYGGVEQGEIRISLDLTEIGLKIIIQDDGEPFDPKCVAEPDLTSPIETRCERGLGVFLIHEVMDGASYDFSTPGVNQLTMVKLFTPIQKTEKNDKPD
ncbi:MAG TPA: ATP-binding protein [Anaerolineaceae bacterium]|nr:ATP-binding protein [Anaerolineaceae bacterium]